MSDVAIRIDGLGKKYRIRHQQGDRYVALRDVLSDRARALFRRKRQYRRPALEDFWALKDVSFEVKRGEVTGVIGRNGAGKSTLLKVISRITEPTVGRIELTGRVASMLEVGTGFHPELTGRANIFLNGAILGMRHAEIKRRFDEIVAFSEVENFLDTPVKRFSSGMYVRLAFAVAAHLHTEILIVDEVLAVGDAEFQRKCLGRMSEVAQGGRTVLFVSHNMAAIRRLTQRCIVLDQGQLKLDAPPKEAIEYYLKESSAGVAEGCFIRAVPRPDDRPFYIERVATARAPDGEPTAQFDCDQPIYIAIDYFAARPVGGLHGLLQLQRLDGTIVYEADSDDSGFNPFDGLTGGRGTIGIKIPERILGPATYQMYLTFYADFDTYGRLIDVPGAVGAFTLDDTSTRRGNRRQGFLSLRLPWRVESRAAAESLSLGTAETALQRRSLP
jgi:homopolymeric O-antigen transport system ATP-binding protein